MSNSEVHFTRRGNKDRVMGVYFVFTLYIFLVDGVFGDEVTTESVMEGESVTLNTGVTKQQRDKMRWYFNDTLIALINGENSTSCLYDGEGGIFRDRLKVDYESGSLTITDIRPEHTGHYEANFIQSKSSGTSQSLNRNSKCDSTKIIQKMRNIGDTVKTFSVSVSASVSDKPNKMGNEQESDQEFSGLSSGAVAGIVVTLLPLVLAAAAGVIYYQCRRSRNDREKNKQVLLLKV